MHIFSTSGKNLLVDHNICYLRYILLPGIRIEGNITADVCKQCARQRHENPDTGNHFSHCRSTLTSGQCSKFFFGQGSVQGLGRSWLGFGQADCAGVGFNCVLRIRVRSRDTKNIIFLLRAWGQGQLGLVWVSMFVSMYVHMFAGRATTKNGTKNLGH